MANLQAAAELFGTILVLFAISVLGFLLAAGAEGYFVRLFGNLIDEWDNEAARAAATIPLMMAAAAGLRAIGTIVGEA